MEIILLKNLYMFEKELELLLSKEWEKNEKDMLDSLSSNLKYYKKLLPKSLKDELASALRMCNELKIELENFRQNCKCNN
jgi:hypothetical protein